MEIIKAVLLAVCILLSMWNIKAFVLVLLTKGAESNRSVFLQTLMVILWVIFYYLN